MQRSPSLLVCSPSLPSSQAGRFFWGVVCPKEGSCPQDILLDASFSGNFIDFSKCFSNTYFLPAQDAENRYLSDFRNALMDSLQFLGRKIWSAQAVLAPLKAAAWLPHSKRMVRKSTQKLRGNYLTLQKRNLFPIALHKRLQDFALELFEFAIRRIDLDDLLLHLL